MNTPEQIPFDFDHRPALGGADFLVAACNSDAVGWVDRWPDWTAPVLCVSGPAGSGKSHLGQAFLARTGGRLLDMSRLGVDAPEVLLAEASAWFLDDAEHLVDEGLEEAFFHLYNAALGRGSHVLLAARKPPAAWPFTLADLASRLRAAPAVAIGAPDDALLGALLVKLFYDRQLKVDTDVVSYMIPRMDRSFAGAQALVDAIDRSALASNRKITVPLVRDVMNKQ